MKILMNMRTTLMMMAATMAPLYAQEPAESTAQIYARLTAPAAGTSATAEQRAAAYPALSVLPADIESVFTMNQIAELSTAIPAAFGADPEDTPSEMTMIESLSIATGKGSVEFCKHLDSIFTYFYQQDESIPIFFTALADSMPNPAGATVRKLGDAYFASVKAAALSSIKTAKVPALYGVLTSKAENAALLAAWYDSAVQGTRSGIEENESSDEMREVYSKNGFEGIKITLKGDQMVSPDYDFDEDTGKLIKKPLNEMQTAIRDAVDGRVLYLVFKLEGNKLISIITENEADIALPADAAQSFLGSDKLAKADANLGKSPIMLAYTAPGMFDTLTNIELSAYIGLPGLAKDIFTELASQPGENQATWAAAAKGTELLCNTYKPFLLPNSTQPELLQIWSEGATIQLQQDGSTQGVNYTPGKLSLTSVPDKPSTILYFEGTPATYGSGNAGYSEIIDAIVNVADGVIAAIPAENQAELAPQVAMAKQFLPDLKDLCGALGTIAEGMGNSTALTVDSAGSMPMILGGTPGNKTAIPRICFYSGVTDRSKLSEGWDKIVTVAANVATKLGSDPSVVNMLPIVPATKGNMTSYSVAMPWFTPDMVPNVTISDTAFTAGTSSNYNEEIVTCATGSTPFAGVVCTIKFGPIATTARGIANELATIAKAEKESSLSLEDNAPAATTDEEDYDGEDYIEEDDYEEEESYSYRRTSPAEERAEQMEEVADMLENVAKLIDRVDGTTTAEGNSRTIRMQIQLRK